MQKEMYKKVLAHFDNKVFSIQDVIVFSVQSLGYTPNNNDLLILVSLFQRHKHYSRICPPNANKKELFFSLKKAEDED